MAFDSLVMTAVVTELSEKLTGGRISKIYQPEPDELILLLYAGGRNYRLVLSAHPRYARLHLTGVEKKNPPSPPTFCMLMRKYLDGGRVLSVQQVGRERICHIRVGVTDELGNPAQFLLIAEVMGKHSNVVLINPQGRIVDAVRRVTEEVNRYRELLPGLTYVPPPPLQKLDPDSLTGRDLTAGADPAAPPWQVLLDRVDGLGPLLAREAAHRAGAGEVGAALADADPDRFAAAVRAVLNPAEFHPQILLDPKGRVKDFHVIPLAHWPGSAQGGFASPSACLDAYYGRREQEERFSSSRGTLLKLVRDEAARARRKLTLQKASLQGAENADELRVRGELITANLWQIQKGDATTRVVNYYDPDGAEVEIPLDPSLGPAENAQRYYRRYQKARSGLEAIRAQIELSKAELDYLEQVEVALEEAVSLPDLEEIRRELQAEGYLSEGRRRPGRQGQGPGRPGGAGSPGRGDSAEKEKAAPPITLLSSDGLEIWIGRNNRQNDYLTLRLAAPHDIWLHTKEIPGSHVILRVPPGREVPERSLHEAAALAAYHSKGRESASVPVDYALRKHVRKPAGARPGMVIYDHQRTLWVTPDPELNPILKHHLGGGGHGAGEDGAPDSPADAGEH